MSHDYTELHCHTNRSLLDSICRPEELVSRAKELNYSAVTITDHGMASAIIYTYKLCQEETEDSPKIKFIPGIEFYLSPTDDHTLREKLPDHPTQQCYHLTALAMNETGVKEIYKLSSLGYTEGFYYHPRVSIKLLEDIGKNLIFMGACVKGPVNWNIVNGNPAAAKKYLERLWEAFKGRFYIEVMDHGLDFQKKLNKVLFDVAPKYRIPIVATNDVHFITKEDHYAHTIMMGIKQKKTLRELKEGNGMIYPEENYLKSAEEMLQLFPRDVVQRTREVADRIDVTLELDVPHFPIYIEDN